MKVPPIKELRKIVHKSKNDNRYIEFLRIFSIYFTKFFLYTPLSPNHVTIITFLIAIASSIFFSFGQYVYSIIASLLMMLAFIFDCVDGEVARYKKKGTIEGSYFDDISYYFVLIVPFIGLSFGSYKILQNNYIFLLGFLAIFSLLFSYFIILMRSHVFVEKILKRDKQEIKKKKKEKEEEILKENMKEAGFIIQKKSFFRKSYDLLVIIFQLHGIINILLFFSLIGYPYLGLFFYGILSPFFLMFNIYYQFKKGLDKYIQNTKEFLR